MTGFTFDAYNLTSGTFVASLVDIGKTQISFVYSDLGAIKFAYPREGRYAVDIQNAAVTGLEIVTLYDGVEIDDGRFIVQAIDGDQVVEDDRFWNYAGIGFGDVLRKVLVYAKTKFVAKTAGEIVKTLLTTASSRGAFGATATSTTTFSNTLDSAGVAWGATYTIEFNVGQTMRDVLNTLSERGAIDLRFTGRSLKLFRGNTLGTVLNDIVVTPSRGLSETPVKWSLQDQANVALMEGDGGVTVERTTAGARREEIFLQQSGVADVGTLSVLGDAALAGLAVVQEQRTVKLEAGSATQAIRDFKVGDFILYYVEDSVPAESMRVRQIVVDVDDSGMDSAAVILNDRILEGEIRRAQSLQLLSGGVDAGSGGTTTEPPAVDTTIPSPPTSLSVGSTAYLDAIGTPRVVVTATWAAVTTNVGGSIIEDLAGYALFMRNEDNPASPFSWLGQVTGGGTSLSVGGVPANVFRRFVVRAFDQSGNYSADSNEFRFQTVTDTTAPNTPSTPTVSPYLGQLRVFWNGLDSGGGAMPIDFNRVEVHVSTSTGFTPSSATKVDELRGGGYSIITDLPYATSHFVKLVAIDNAGNASTPSAQGTAIPETVTGLDIAALTIATTNMADLAISTAKIADLAVINAKIANLAVDDAKIASLSVGKLTAGSLVADVTVSARIKTANTGARAELNTLGIEAYNAAGTRTFFVQASTGNVTILGNFQTGIAGGAQPYMTIDDSGDRTTIAFYNAAGTKNAFINSPAGTTTPQLGLNTGQYIISGATLGYGRLFLREPGINLETVRASDQTVFGGALALSSTSARLRSAPLGGASTGGEVFIDASGVQITQNTAGVANTSGRLRAESTQAVMEFTNASGSGVHGIFVDTGGLKTFGTMGSSITWSAVEGPNVTLSEFRMDKFGGIVTVHCFFTVFNAIAAGNITDQTLVTITSTGGLPSSQTSCAMQHAAGVGAVSLDSSGLMLLRWMSTAMAVGETFRVDVAYFRA